AAETAVKEFYDTLSAEQKKVICFPFDHELRRRISANWAITKPRIGDDFYTADQRKLIDRIMRGVLSPDGYERVLQQLIDDDGSWESYHVAVFGEPGTGKFEWEMTGRHLTLRADGDSAENVAFGGPVVYGHGAANPKRNLFHYQTQKANEVFAALEGKQREQALLPKAPPESQVPIQGEGAKFPGIAVGELSKDQQALVEEVIKVILAPYRTEDVEEALATLKQGGGLQKLHMAFYQTGDLLADKVWDIWRLEGPTFVWHFRGAPHVHAYVNVGKKG
ncbi:MAG TPA: DUF3500 domain-containing protein, partial [Gemmataceae bacterium]